MLKKVAEKRVVKNESVFEKKQMEF